MGKTPEEGSLENRAERVVNTRIIINSSIRRSKSKRIESALRSQLAGTSVETVRTAYAGHATQIARRSAEDGTDTVIVVGGDGTINEVVSGIWGSNIVLGIIPAGTANDIACHYRIPKNVEHACRIIAARNTRRVDAISVNSWHYLATGGVGIPCDAIRFAEAFRRCWLLGWSPVILMGSLLYVWGLMCALLRYSRWRHPLIVENGNQRWEVDAFSLTVGLFPTLGKHYKILPGAAGHDGRMGICLIENCQNPLRLLRSVFSTLSGRHIGMANVQTFRTTCLSVRSRRPISLFGDGEIRPRSTLFRMKHVPGVVNLIVPRREQGELI